MKTVFLEIGFTLVLAFLPIVTFGQSGKWSEDSIYLNAHLFDQPDSALKICEAYLKKSKKENRRYAYLRSRMAVIDDVQGRPDEAVGGFLKAISIQEKLKDSVELSFSYNNLGICQFYMYRYDEAIANYRKSARIDSLMEDLKGWSGTMVNIAIIYSNQDKVDDALFIYDNVLRMMNEVNDHSLDASIYSNQAKLQVLNKEYNKALESTSKASEIIESGNDPSSKMTLQVIASNANMGLFRFDQALSAARKGVGYDQGNNYPERRSHLYECMSHAFFAKSMIDSAYFYDDLYQEIRDSLFTSESQQQLSEIQTKYGVAKRKEELAASKLKEAKYRNKSIRSARDASVSREQRNLFIALAAVLVAIGLVLWLVLQRRRSEKALLQEKLHSQEQLVLQKEAFLGEIHHRVRNNLQMVSSMLAMQQRAIGEEATIQVLEASRSRIETMSLIHERLYKKTAGKSIELNEYVEQLTNQIVEAYSSKNLEVAFDIEELQLHIDSMIPLALILNELLTNSLKYAFQEDKGRIKISIYEKENELLLDYCDSGKGFDSGNAPGFGSQLMQSLSRQLKASREQGMEADGFHQKFYIQQYKKSEE